MNCSSLDYEFLEKERRACRRLDNKPDAYRIVCSAVSNNADRLTRMKARHRTQCVSACLMLTPTSDVLCLSARSNLTGRCQNAVSVGALEEKNNVRNAVPVSAYEVDRPLKLTRRVCRRVDRRP
ncbi:hypothetical protein NDU88_002311 [Pleurodeles waltl]|uniref:Uncharacterized protein n=1 Tax=Pleurodeles waltl TaxID=8319 RepID=A0AAV7UY20_PLEWA|nr:hypothetical protein NDU88_002311 [Pleurodeles waltl]